MSATPGLKRYRTLRSDYDTHAANTSNPHSVTAAQLGLTGPMDYKGTITLAADFPTLAAVATGDTYRISTSVTDNDATKTNTGQSFVLGEEAIWNGTGWDVFQGDLTPAAQAAGSGAAGVAIPVTAGAGAAASGGTAGAAGGALTMAAGAGGASDGTDAAAAGGAASLSAGAGGAANTAIAGANGAAATVAGGAGGAGSAGAAAGNGGNAVVNAGAGGADGGGGAGTDGNVTIGAANTASVLIGNATDNPVTTFQGTGLVTIPNILVNGLGNQAVTPTAQASGGGTVGANVTARAGDGSEAAGGTAGAVGGAIALTGGAGGASDGTDAAAAGGAASLTAGAGGAANTAIAGANGAAATVAGGTGGAGSAGAAGGNGGNTVLNAGAGGADGGGGAGTDGKVTIAAANTASIEIGNATDNPVTSFLGTGDVSLLGGGDLRYGRLVQVVITATGGAGGATAGTISVQVNDLNGTAITRAVNLRLDISGTDMAGPLAAAGTAQFGAASTGTLVVGSGAAAAVVTTDATGLYAGALSNAADETVYFSATTAPGGFANNAAGCVVVDAVTDSATWSA